jgi:hypothetical protein
LTIIVTPCQPGSPQPPAVASVVPAVVPMAAARVTETIVDDGGRASGVVVGDAVPMADNTVNASDAARSVVKSAAMERTGVKPATMEPPPWNPPPWPPPPCPRAKARFGWQSAAMHSTAAAPLPRALFILGRALFSLRCCKAPEASHRCGLPRPGPAGLPLKTARRSVSGSSGLARSRTPGVASGKLGPPAGRSTEGSVGQPNALLIN